MAQWTRLPRESRTSSRRRRTESARAVEVYRSTRRRRRVSFAKGWLKIQLSKTSVVFSPFQASRRTVLLLVCDSVDGSVSRRETDGAVTNSPAFATTHWSVVLAAEHDSSPGSQEALEKLCRTYWYPLYAYIRRRGYSPEDAQDLTQSFFERLLERDLLADLRPAGARFRSFLLHALKNHMASEWTRAHSVKRGGTGAILSLGGLSPEARYAQEAANTENPDAAFERRWGSAVLQQALDRLRQEHVAAGKELFFDILADGLTGAAPSQPYAELAIKLGMTEAAVKMPL